MTKGLLSEKQQVQRPNQTIQSAGATMIRPIRAAVFFAVLGGGGLVACGVEEDLNGLQSNAFELSEADMIANGREIVELQCMTCHAVGTDDRSPRSDAPSLRTVLDNYAPEALAEDFREHIHVGHPDMPDFDFGPIGTDHVLAYLKSIQATDTDPDK